MSGPPPGGMSTPLRGYVSREGRFGRAVRLHTAQEVTDFLREHLYEEEVRMVDAGDSLVFHARDGIDLYSRLAELGISLPALYDATRRTWVAEAERARSGDLRPTHEDEGEPVEREPWEPLYDSIGLSSGEVWMRQQAKRACREARTVADVVELLEGTYFDAHFETEDGRRAWGYFDASECSAEVLRPVGEDAWQGEGRRVRLDPAARVRHKGSGEDVHLFVLLDAPEG